MYSYILYIALRMSVCLSVCPTALSMMTMDQRRKHWWSGVYYCFKSV